MSELLHYGSNTIELDGSKGPMPKRFRLFKKHNPRRRPEPEPPPPPPTLGEKALYFCISGHVINELCFIASGGNSKEAYFRGGMIVLGATLFKIAEPTVSSVIDRVWRKGKTPTIQE